MAKNAFVAEETFTFPSNLDIDDSKICILS